MERIEMKTVKTKHIAAWMAVVMAIAVATGCGIRKPLQKAPQAPAAASRDAKARPQGQLADGRDGFIITEKAGMSGADRRAFDQAVVLLNTGTYDRAIEILKKIAAHAPGVSAPYINLGIAYAAIDKNEAAEAQFKKALDLVPGHPVAGNECGLLYRKQGRFDEARAMFEKALAAHPNYYPVHRNLGILCDLYLNDLQSAMAHYQVFSQAMPEDEQVKLWIADLKARMGGK
jgi:Tfp pilus assembly protein PilF/predicted small lipoprotein YifL